LRNATVAKIAGKDSTLLQISGEERERVARVANLFSEEDLTRHLQIMLRTHGELSYKQEQRFHLELGLLKMSHAQKLLPIEQLLSDVGTVPPSGTQRPATKPAIVGGATAPDTRRADASPSARPNYVSPFAADSARKGTPRQEDASSDAPPPGPRIVAQASQPEPVIMGSAAPAPAPLRAPDPVSDRRDVATYVSADAESNRERKPELQQEPTQAPSQAPLDQIDRLQGAVLQALTDANQRILVSMLSSGEWSVQGNELVIKVSESQTVVDMSLGPEGKRLAIATASGVLGRAIKLKVVPGATVAPQEKKNGGPRLAPGPGGRSRAEQDPVVRRMQEKFGAEIRTVIDYRDKR
jgi:DNA polymerase-3 subunit gamma/tau